MPRYKVHYKEEIKYEEMIEAPTEADAREEFYKNLTEDRLDYQEGKVLEFSAIRVGE